uniref:Uncharacterized protein n=1 Tax=uncultured marine virus TaxID=186617 RepID=A0A0F7L5F6_9VIRU|nr:hypothetical protein [uncultured marine virus]
MIVVSPRASILLYPVFPFIVYPEVAVVPSDDLEIIEPLFTLKADEVVPLV